ncbi:SRPBCC domain-containing protein [uncultured Imperialibacter sp.]|uniref:SRPBCC family protein n=1 Tax=uncultured Imperialibacter sp. TaxID=1672639 RepID=UPI0030DC51E9|tara:strand:- start:17454 stop:17957 length:504 start_codon:yes stop_codon:yes gene_type:complete
MNAPTISNKDKLRLSYEFNAPKEMVFNAFSTAEALNESWGPVETKNSAISLDFRPGGVFHFSMKFGDHVNYARFLFKTIEPYDLLAFTNAFADEKGNPIPAPFDVKLPVEIFYSLRFTETGGKTSIELTGEPFDATQEEINGFNSIAEDMQRGFGATFSKLTDFLKK